MLSWKYDKHEWKAKSCLYYNNEARLFIIGVNCDGEFTTHRSGNLVPTPAPTFKTIDAADRYCQEIEKRYRDNCSPQMLALAKLVNMSSPPSTIYRDTNVILCELLTAIGYIEVVAAYRLKTDKLKVDIESKTDSKCSWCGSLRQRCAECNVVTVSSAAEENCWDHNIDHGGEG